MLAACQVWQVSGQRRLLEPAYEVFPQSGADMSGRMRGTGTLPPQRPRSQTVDSAAVPVRCLRPPMVRGEQL